MANKVSKWDLKKAAKLMGLDWSSETEAKINELRGVGAPEATNDVPIDQAAADVINQLTEEAKPQKETVAFGVVQQGHEFLVVRLSFNMDEATVLMKTDMEARAVLERGKAEAEYKKDEYKRRK